MVKVEPHKGRADHELPLQRKVSLIVPGFLAMLFMLIYVPKKEIWKDIH